MALVKKINIHDKIRKRIRVMRECNIKTILLTGSGGFIGKNLKEFLADKYNLLTPRSFELDLSDTDSVKKYFASHETDFVIHCASVGGIRTKTDEDTTVETNLRMFNNIKNCLNGKRMIFFGSGAQYDRTRPLKRVKEEELGLFEPKELYGKAKMLIAEEIKKTDNILCLNIFGAYGKYELETRFPSYAIKQNLNKEAIVINQNVVFDYIYIEDLLNIISYFILHKPKKNIINVTPDESISLLSLSQIVNESGEYKSEIIVKNPIMNNEYTGCNDILKSEIKDIKFTSYKDGMKKLYNIIKNSRG